MIRGFSTGLERVLLGTASLPLFPALMKLMSPRRAPALGGGLAKILMPRFKISFDLPQKYSPQPKYAKLALQGQPVTADCDLIKIR